MFVKIGMELPFTIKNKRRNIYKFEIWLLKSTVLDPRKSEFLVYEENPQTNFFCMFRLWFSFKNSRHINVLLVCIFANAQKKLLMSKTQFWPFLAVNSGFLCVFKNTDQSNISASIVFKAKTKENICLRFLLQNSKMPFLGGQPILFS